MELTPIELENNLGPDANGVVHRVPWIAYDKDEVDQLIAEKDKKIAQLKADLEDLWDDKRYTDKLLDERNAEIAQNTFTIKALQKQLRKSELKNYLAITRLRRQSGEPESLQPIQFEARGEFITASENKTINPENVESSAEGVDA